MKNSIITNNDIKVLGRVVSIASENKLAEAEQVWDTAFNFDTISIYGADDLPVSTDNGCDQSTINKYMAAKLKALFDTIHPDPDSDSVIFNKKVVLGNGMDVTGNSILHDNVAVGGNLNVDGDVVSGGDGSFENIHVHFATDTNTIDVESDARIGGNLNLTGNAVIGGLITANGGADLRGDLNLNGYRILNALSFAVDNATIRNTLTAKNIDVEKNISADHIEANSANFADKINVGDGQSNFEGFVYIQGADEGHPLLDGDPNVNHGLKVEGDTLIDGMIDVGEFHPHTHATTERYGVVRLASSPGDNDDDDVITTNILKLLAKVSSTISWEFGDNFNEGDMLYFDGNKWTIMNIGNIIKKWSYWMISGTNLVPNTTNTGGIVDVKTTGAIYSGK